MNTSKWYVSMTDKDMSGQGVAYRKISKLVIECDTREQAHLVATNAKLHTSMVHVSIRRDKPVFPSVMYHTDYLKYKELGPLWIEPR